MTHKQLSERAHQLVPNLLMNQGLHYNVTIDLLMLAMLFFEGLNQLPEQEVSIILKLYNKNTTVSLDELMNRFHDVTMKLNQPKTYQIIRN